VKMDVGEQATATDVIVTGTITVTVADPDFVVSWVEVALIVSEPELGTVAGAVYTPELDIVPETAAHVTAELYAPVPDTTAEHWLVCPVGTLVGVQEAATELTVGVTVWLPLVPPPPQLVTGKTLENSPMESRRTAALRFIGSLVSCS